MKLCQILVGQIFKLAKSYYPQRNRILKGLLKIQRMILFKIIKPINAAEKIGLNFFTSC